MTGHECSGAASLLALAAIAALGVWVLRQAEKDGGAVKRAGQAVGWALAVVGLAGFFCGTVGYGMKKYRICRVAPGASSGVILPPCHPPIIQGK